MPPQDPIAISGRWTKSKRYRQLEPHRNNGLEIVLVTRGTVNWRIEDRVVASPPGSALFTFPWQVHAPADAIVPANELIFTVFSLDGDYRDRPGRFAFHPAMGLTAEQSRRIVRTLRSAPRQVVAQSGSLRWLMDRMVDERDARREDFQSVVAGLARCAVIELSRLVIAADTGQVAGAERSVHRVRQFVAALRQRCAEPWTLDAMAEACDLSRTQFAELFKQETGDTPILGLSRARVDMACGLLTGTDRSITEIAFDTGFQTSQYFAKVFKQITGRTPSEHRGR